MLKGRARMFTSLQTGTLGFSAPFEEALQLAADNGFEGLDVPLNELLERVQKNTSIQEIKDRYQAAGVRPGGWGLPVDFRQSEEQFQAGMEQLPHYAQLAHELGSPWCSTWILPFSDTLDYEANMELHVRRLRSVAQVLADHSIQFGLEFVGPKTMRDGHAYSFIHTIDGALELGRRIQTGNTGLLLDSWHWYTAHATIDDIRRLQASDVIYVHVNDAPPHLSVDEQIDNQRLLPGASGIIDITGFLQALQHIGYTGPVVVEPFSSEVNALPPAERVRVTGESLRKVMRQAGLR